MTLPAEYLTYPYRRPGMDHDRYAYSNLFTRKPVEWPGGARVALWIVALGNALVVPLGAAVGWVAGRARERRVVLLGVVAPGAALLAWLLAELVLPGSGSFALAVPGILVAVPLGLLLERWTRVEAERVEPGAH